MRKFKLIGLALLLSVLIFTSLIACSDKSDDENTFRGDRNISDSVIRLQESEYFVEIFEFPTLAMEYSDVGNVVVAHDKIYFTAYAGDAHSPFIFPMIFRMNLDGTEVDVIELHTETTLPAYIISGAVSIESLHIDNEGNIWVIETENLFMLELPDADSEEEQEYHIRELDRVQVVRKLDSQGIQLLLYCLGELAVDYEWFSATMLSIDNDENIVISASAESNTAIYVVDTDGNTIFSLNTTAESGKLVNMPDGSVSFSRWQGGEKLLKNIDVNGQAWGETMYLPQNAQSVFSGSGEFCVLFSNKFGVFGIPKDTNEVVQIINFIESGVSPCEVLAVSFSSTEQIVVISVNEGFGSGNEEAEIFLFTKVSNVADTHDVEEVEKTVLRLGTLWVTPEIRNAVVQFNNKSTTYIIEVIDYSIHNVQSDSWAAALSRLSVEIIAGDGPDILFLINIPFNHYVERGLFVDLNPLLDEDPVVNRDALFGSVLVASESNGKLYRVPMSFGISTIVGHPSIVGTSQGWDMAEFRMILEENSQADFPLGPWQDKLGFLELMFFHNMSEYVNREAGTVYFDTEHFVQLLNLANTFPMEIDTELAMADLATHEMIATGRQIMSGSGFSGFDSFHSVRERFGGDIAFKGWPSEERDGNKFRISDSFAIMSNTSNVNGAWEFIRMLLEEDFQRGLSDDVFPMNRVVFNERLAEAMTPPGNLADPENVLSQVAVDQLLALIYFTTGVTGHGESEALWEIVSEMAMEFFNGQIYSVDAARIIQNRAMLYIAEHGR